MLQEVLFNVDAPSGTDVKAFLPEGGVDQTGGGSVMAAGDRRTAACETTRWVTRNLTVDSHRSSFQTGCEKVRFQSCVSS